MFSKRIFLLLAALLFSSVSGFAQMTSARPLVTPIFIDVTMTSGLTNLAVSGRTMTQAELERWFLQNHKVFGGTDPVVVRFTPDITTGYLLTLRKCAMKTNPEVHLLFPDGSSYKELVVSDDIPSWFNR